MITPIEVLDSAVKIGLGAAISAFAAYWLAKTSYDKTFQKERAQRKRELLETVAQHVANFNHAAFVHWAATVNWLKFTPLNEPMSVEQKGEFSELKNKFRFSEEQLISAEAKLLLLGEMKCYSLLRDYNTSVFILNEGAISARQVIVAELNEYKEKIRTKREAFFTMLSEIYRRT